MSAHCDECGKEAFETDADTWGWCGNPECCPPPEPSCVLDCTCKTGIVCRGDCTNCVRCHPKEKS